MANDFSLSERNAQLEIAMKILTRSLDGTLKWGQGSNNEIYVCRVNDLLTAFLSWEGPIRNARRWEVFHVLQGSTSLVTYYYPTSKNQSLGQMIAPPEAVDLLNQFFAQLKSEEFSKTYGQALESLKGL